MKSTWLVSRLIFCVLVSGAVVAADAPQDTFARVLQEVQAFRGRDVSLPLPEGTPARYRRRMEDVSAERYALEAKSLTGFAERLAALDRSALTPALQTDAEILSRQLRDRLNELRFRGFEMPIGSREGFHFSLPALPDRFQFTTVAAYDNYIASLQSFRAHTAQRIAMLRAGLKAGRALPRQVLDDYDAPVAAQIHADVTASPLYQPFTQVPDRFSAEDQDRIRRDGAAALRESVMPALQEFLEFLRREYIPGAPTTMGLAAMPDGDAFYRHRIRMHTTLELSPREVHDIGLREVARVRAEMEQVKARAGFTGTLAEFMRFLQTDPKFRVSTEEAYLQAVAMAAKRMDGELPKLFSILPRTPYGVRAMPAHIAIRQSAGYYDSGAANGSRAGWVNINTSDLAARPLYVVEALTFHEGAPGHHLQIMRTQESTTLSGFRKGLGITVFTEGWGLYAERLGRDAGFYTDPYSDFGRLTYEIWRAVRLVVDSGVHAFGWTREQAIAYMADNTGFQRGPATAETDRHITEAGQGLAYTFGLLKILDLRGKAEAALGDRFDIRAFHEAILANGPLPLDLLEREVTAWIDARRPVGQELPLQRIPSGKPIAEADDRELMRLTKQHGAPWLIVEPEEVQVQGNWHARVYLQPDSVSAPVRRGRLLLFSARTPPGHTGEKTWQVGLSAYAQVPAEGAGAFSRTAQDLPFVEWERLPDADLLSLVAFVRSSPSAPERSNPTGRLHRIEGRMPIRSIRRGEGRDIEVAVMRGDSETWVLTVRQDGGKWRAVDVSYVIA